MSIMEPETYTSGGKHSFLYYVSWERLWISKAPGVGQIYYLFIYLAL